MNRGAGDSTAPRFHRGLRWLTHALLVAAAIIVFVIAALITFDIISRAASDTPIRGVTELVAVLIPAIVFLALPRLLLDNKLIRSDVLLKRIAERFPLAGRALQLVFHGLGALVTLGIAVPSMHALAYAWRTSEFIGVEGDFTVPVWPSKFAIVVGASLLALLCTQAFRRTLVQIRDDAGRAAMWRAVALSGVVSVGTVVLLNFGIDDRASAGVLSIVLMFALIYLGAPVAFALGAAATLGIALIKDASAVAVETLALVADSTVSDYVFAAVPLFVLMGLIVGAAEIGRDSLHATHFLLRRVRGGFGVATVAANAVFAAITGISIASAAIFSRVAVPPLIEHGFSPRFAVGLVAGSSVLGMLIPPSLLLIVYGLVAEVSINRLFLAAIVPGLILTGAFAAAVMLVATLKPAFAISDAAALARGASGDGAGAVRQIAPVAVLIVVVLGGIYGGVFTPTEAGAIGAVTAAILALAMKRICVRELGSLLADAASSSSSILFLIIAASAFAIMLTLSGIPGALSDGVANADLGLTAYALVYVVVLIVLGMVLDSTSILLIMVPLALPTIQLLGGDLVWFGIITVIGVEIGLLTPPLGLSVFAIKASLEDDSISLRDIFIGACPFSFIMLIVTIALACYPRLAQLY